MGTAKHEKSVMQYDPVSKPQQLRSVTQPVPESGVHSCGAVQVPSTHVEPVRKPQQFSSIVQTPTSPSSMHGGGGAVQVPSSQVEPDRTPQQFASMRQVLSESSSSMHSGWGTMDEDEEKDELTEELE